MGNPILIDGDSVLFMPTFGPYLQFRLENLRVKAVP